MPDLNIKNARTYELARHLSELTGESMTGAVTVALEERIERIERDFNVEEILTMAREIRDRLPPGYLDQDFDELLYDERGLPK
jgi:antitoxin VapB